MLLIGRHVITEKKSHNTNLSIRLAIPFTDLIHI